MKLKDLPVSMGSKLVGSQVREWGRTVHSSSHANLMRKYKVYDKWCDYLLIKNGIITIIKEYQQHGQKSEESKVDERTIK